MGLVRRVRSFALVGVVTAVGRRLARRVARTSEKNNGGRPTSLSQALYLVAGRH